MQFLSCKNEENKNWLQKTQEVENIYLLSVFYKMFFIKYLSNLKILPDSQNFLQNRLNYFQMQQIDLGDKN